jgi:hypothetical protein
MRERLDKLVLYSYLVKNRGCALGRGNAWVYHDSPPSVSRWTILPIVCLGMAPEPSAPEASVTSEETDSQEYTP